MISVFYFRNITHSCGKMYTHTHAPICDFNSSRCSKFVAGGGFDSHFHATELFIVFLIHSSPPVFGPAAVPGPQWPVAFF